MLKEYKDLADQLKSLAHPDRIAIVKLMCDCNCRRMTVKSIYEKLRMRQPIASRHLSIMRNSGLLKREQDGNTTYYGLCIEKKTVNSFIQLFKTIF